MKALMNSFIITYVIVFLIKTTLRQLEMVRQCMKHRQIKPLRKEDTQNTKKKEMTISIMQKYSKAVTDNAAR